METWTAWLHLVSDVEIAVACFAVGSAILGLARRHRGKQITRAFLAYGLMFLSGGVTHALLAASPRSGHTVYLLAGCFKALTGLLLVPVAYVTVRCAADALALFRKLAVIERRAAERLVRLQTEERYQTPEDLEWAVTLREIRALAQTANMIRASAGKH